MPALTVSKMRGATFACERESKVMSTFREAEDLATMWRSRYKKSEGYVVRRTSFNTGPHSKPVRKHIVRVYSKSA